MATQSKLQLLDLPNENLLGILAHISPLDLIAFRQSFDDVELERHLVLDENWERLSPRVRPSRYITLASPFDNGLRDRQLLQGRYMFIASHSSLILHDLEPRPGAECQEPIFHLSEPRCRYFFSSRRIAMGISDPYADIHIPMIKRKYPTHDSVIIWRLQPSQKPHLLQVADLSAPPAVDIPDVCISNGLLFSDQGRKADDPRLIPTIYDIATQKTYRFPTDIWYAHNQHYIEYLPEINTILITHTNERGGWTSPPQNTSPMFVAYSYPPPGNQETLSQTHLNRVTFPGLFSEPRVIRHQRTVSPSGAPATELSLAAVFTRGVDGQPGPIDVRLFTVLLSADSTDITFDVTSMIPNQSPGSESRRLSLSHGLAVTSNNTGRARVVLSSHHLGQMGGYGDIALFKVGRDGWVSSPVTLASSGRDYLFDGFRGRLVCLYSSNLEIVDFV
ncbi:hypothetical protein PQX77_009416 [Marasmius sp. AFHP31]|nr:hypothetical protein PQX77_009416 [Marasmius sp. AFHP31]